MADILCKLKNERSGDTKAVPLWFPLRKSLTTPKPEAVPSQGHGFLSNR